MNKIFIAEIKTQSPFGFTSKTPKNRLVDLALEYGDWISVHTDARFGGGFDDIYRIRTETKKPILAKGFHCHNDDVQKCIDLGADYVLVVDRFFQLSKELEHKILFEFSDFSRVKTLYEGYREDYLNEYYKFVYNGRNLRNGASKNNVDNYKLYRNQCKWLCGASLIQHPNHVEQFYPDCNAYIVGEHLAEYCSYLYERPKI